MNKLPNSWKITKLTNVCTRITDGSHFSPKTNETGKPYVTVKDISSSGDIDLLNCKKISIEDFEELVRGNCKPSIGDVLLSKDGTVGKTALVKSEEHFVVLSSLAILSPNKVVNSRYLYLFLNSPSFQEKAIGSKTGAAIKRIVLRTIKEFDIPLPPLPEQTRIVNKLDSLFERIDKSIALLEENIKNTEALMASVLDEIFSKINAKRFQVKDLSKNIQYGYTGKALDKGEYYYLRITDIQNGKVNFSNTPYSDIPESQVDKYVLKHGDILFARTGATAGKSYLFNDNEKSVFASYLIRVVCNDKVLIPNYLYCFFQSKGYWDQIFGNIVGAAQPNFNGKKLGEIIVPLPDINTQQKIIEKFESLTKYFEQITIQQQSKLSYLKALKASLLDKAFKGEL